MDENMDINQLDENIDQLEKEILKNREEIHNLNKKRDAINNHTLGQVAGKIAEKIVKDKLYQDENLENRYVYTNVDPRMVFEGVVLSNCDIDDGYLDTTMMGDNESDVLSITFNIKYDHELREIMNQDWKTLGRQSV